MATNGGQYLDIAEIRKGTDGNGVAVDVINMMAQTNGVHHDAVWRECNSRTSHKHSVIAGLPSATWGRLYKGVKNDRAKRMQVTDTTGFIEASSQVDARLAKLEKNLSAFRLQEAQSFIESMSQELARSIFYEDVSINPDRFTGFAPRFNDLSAANGNQVIDAGGEGNDNTSIWFVTWGGNSCHLLYPEGTSYGIERHDKGEQKVFDDDGNAYYALEERFEAHCGLAVRDWRKVVRIANIDVSDLRAGTVDLYKYMRKAWYQLHGQSGAQRGTQSIDSGNGNFNMERVAIYCNGDIFEALDAIGTNSGSNDNFIRLKSMEIQGRQVETYRQIPVVRVDQIVNSEARVT